VGVDLVDERCREEIGPWFYLLSSGCYNQRRQFGWWTFFSPSTVTPLSKPILVSAVGRAAPVYILVKITSQRVLENTTIPMKVVIAVSQQEYFTLILRLLGMVVI
jgi:hypothetical protein